MAWAKCKRKSKEVLERMGNLRALRSVICIIHDDGNNDGEDDVD